eukprot:1949262-Amphidinium_carterae.1
MRLCSVLPTSGDSCSVKTQGGEDLGLLDTSVPPCSPGPQLDDENALRDIPIEFDRGWLSLSAECAPSSNDVVLPTGGMRGLGSRNSSHADSTDGSRGQSVRGGPTPTQGTLLLWIAEACPSYTLTQATVLLKAKRVYEVLTTKHPYMSASP